MKIQKSIFALSAALFFPSITIADSRTEHVRILTPTSSEHNVNSCIGAYRKETDSIGSYEVEYRNTCHGPLNTLIFVAKTKYQLPPVQGAKSYVGVAEPRHRIAVFVGHFVRVYPMDIMACAAPMKPQRIIGDNQNFKCLPDPSGDAPSLKELQTKPVEEPRIPAGSGRFFPPYMKGRLSDNKHGIYDVIMQQDGEEFRVHYPDLNCESMLTRIDDGINTTFRERNTKGNQKCNDGGFVTFEKDGGQWKVGYRANLADKMKFWGIVKAARK